jgi:hypothetical protein
MTDFEKLATTLVELGQDPNWQTRSVKLREELGKNGIEVKPAGGATLGRCYEAMHYEIHSGEELPNTFIRTLRDLGLLGYGQEFFVRFSTKRGDKYVVNTEARVDSSD